MSPLLPKCRFLFVVVFKGFSLFFRPDKVYKDILTYSEKAKSRRLIVMRGDTALEHGTHHD